MASRRFPTALLVCAMAALVACRPSPAMGRSVLGPALESRTATIADEDAVYAAVLADIASRYYPRGDSLYVAVDVPAKFASVEKARADAQDPGWRRFTALDSDQLHLGWMTANAEARRVVLPATLGGLPVAMTDSLSPRRVLGSWRYVQELSRVGFNTRGDSGAVLVESVCRNLC